MSKIKKVDARQILDSRGFPTVEAQVELADGSVGRAASPSGASTGVHEALELRDSSDPRFLGKGVYTAVKNVKETIAPALSGQDPEDLNAVDGKMIEIDGTENKSKLGANAILAVSLASAHAAANSKKITLCEWISKQARGMGYEVTNKMPIPLMNVINGGAHADNGLDIQEFMLVPHGFSSFTDSLRAGVEIFHHLKKTLSEQGLSTSVGDEGGFAPQIQDNTKALELLMQAIEKAGYKAGDQVSLALDVASSEFYKDGHYQFTDPSIGKANTQKVVDFYASLAGKFPILSIEDPMAEDDWEGWKALTTALGSRCQLVGDDLFVTQVARLKTGVESGAGNAILIKLNQVGSLLETLQTMKFAHDSSFKSIVSHRSGETEDCSLAHLAVASGCGQVKTGSASRSDRMAKYNELLRLEEALGCALAKWGD